MRLLSKDKVKNFFPNHRIETISTFFLLSQSIFLAKSVNLNKCVKQIPIIKQDSEVNLQNAYKQFIRFFKMQNSGQFCIGIALMILDLIKGLEQNDLLIIDRTNWKLGKTNFNILQIGIGLTSGVMIPLLGIPLIDKRGNSNVPERIGLLNLFFRFSALLPKKYTIVGDREFIGLRWFHYIFTNGHSFVIRLRSKDYKDIMANSIKVSKERLEKRIRRKVNKNGFYFQAFEMDGMQMFVLVVKNKKNRKDPYVRLLSNKENITEILDSYNFRWSIEVYFRKTKTDGFNLEDLNLTDPNKVFLMVLIVGFLYTKTILAGLESQNEKPTKKQYFKNRKKTYKRESIFQSGLKVMATKVINFKGWINEIQQSIKKYNVRMMEYFKDLEYEPIPFIIESIFKNV